MSFQRGGNHSLCCLLQVLKKGSLPGLHPLKLPKALKTSSFPDSSSLPEWLRPFLKPARPVGLPCTVAQERRCGAGASSEEVSHCHRGSAQPAVSLWRSSSPAPSLQMEVGERGEKSFSSQMSLRQKWGWNFGKVNGGRGISSCCLTGSNAAKRNG